MENKEEIYIRVDTFHRCLHGLVIISFLGLAMTGLPLKFSESGWARFLASLLGGFEVAGFLHRVCALITFGYFFAHIGYVIRFLLKENKKPILKVIFGPDSFVPRLQDVKDLFNHFKWFFGMGERPKWDRWTYWEKFDYWAVFWGVAIIGSSGLVLWFPTVFSLFFPGWLINIAMIIHSDEALLASGFIFAIHFFNTHLRVGKFPFDPVIFTGRISKSEFIQEHSLHYERLLKEGKLQQYRTDPAPIWLTNLAKVVGFSALGIGIILLVFMIYSGIWKGIILS